MKIVFSDKGTFKALRAAEKWCDKNGYSYGSTCVCSPQALKKGDWHIAKWRNLSSLEKLDIDGTIIGDGREGPIIVEVFEGEIS